MPFALNNDPSQSEISEAINYLLANFGPNLSADPNTGQVTGPSGIVIAYLYRYLAVKFADSFDGSVNFGDSPTNRLYYGVRNTDSDVESTNHADYIWYKVEGGFGTTNFLWYITNGGRQIQFYVGPASPALGYATVGTDSIDLDIITSTTGQISFLAYFQPASLQVVRSGNPLTPSFTGVQPRLYASAGGALTTYVAASTDSDPAFGNNTWRIGGSSTTGTGDITYNQITIGLPTNGGGYALWPAPTAMSGTPASLLVPVRYKNAAGIVSQANVAQVQFVFVDQGPSGDLIAYPSVYQWAASIPTISGTSTYTWATGLFTPNPTSWSATPGASTPGFNLYRAQVTLQATAGTTTSTINWTTASIGSIGSAGTAGTNGSSARICFARVPNNPAPVTGTVSTSGSSSFPSSSQSLSTWGFSATWGATDPNTSSTNSLYQSDGVYDPASNTTNWSTPYISSLKVGQLSAITVNTGTLTVDTTGWVRGGQTGYNTGTGFFLGYSGGAYKFSIGNPSTSALTWNGSVLNIQGTGKFFNPSSPDSYVELGIDGNGSSFRLYRTASTLLPPAYLLDTAPSGAPDTLWVKHDNGNCILANTNTGYAISASGGTDNSITTPVAYFQGSRQQAQLEVRGNQQAGSTSAHAGRFKVMNGSTIRSSAICGVDALNGLGGYYSFYAETGTYGPFTGSHDCLIEKTEVIEEGDIVVDVALIYKKDINNTLFSVTKSTQPNQFGIGVLNGTSELGESDPPAVFLDMVNTKIVDTKYDPEGNFLYNVYEPTVIPEFYDIVDTYNYGIMNAVGEGQVNVCGENGDIAVGDLIVTSSMAGKGMKQADDIMRSYTVAKARQAATFSSPTDIQQIACIYVSG